MRSRSAMQFAARMVGSCARQAPFGFPVVPGSVGEMRDGVLVRRIGRRP